MPVGVSVVIPALNEVDNIGTLVGEVRAALDPLKIPYDIVVVDDASRDNTPRVVEHLATKKAPITLCKHPITRGQSAAILTGVLAAAHDVIVTLDGDGQNDPADIPNMLQAFEKHKNATHPVLIAGYRANRQDSFIKKMSSRVANAVRRGLLQDDCVDSGCGLKLFPRAPFLGLPLFDHFHRFLPALFKGMKGTIITVPVNHRPRLKGTSKYGINNRLWVGITDILGVMWLRRRTRSWTPRER